MQKQIPNYQIKQNLLHEFGHPRKIAKLVTDLKNITDFNSIVQIVSEIIRTIPIFEKRFWGILIPKNIKELAGEEVYFYKPELLRNEINWIILAIKQHIDVIRIFIEKRKLFEHNVLLGEFDKALAILDSLEDEIGVSIWLYESKLIVYELMGSKEKAITLISSINKSKQLDELNEPEDNKKSKKKCKKSEENGFVTLLLYYLYYRSSKDLSALKYDEDLFINFKKNRTLFQKDHYNYYLFRLNFYKHYNIDDPSIPLMMEAPNSLIDRYIVLIQVLQAAYVKGNFDDTIISRSQYLYKLTNDKALLPFIYLKQPDHNDIEYFNKEYIGIIDSYYKGDYQNVIKECKTYIRSNTSNFEILKLYTNSLLLAGNGYKPLYLDSSPINQICIKIYNTISEKDNTLSLYNLYQLNKNLYGFSISNGLDYYIKEEDNSEKSDVLKLLSYSCFDPMFSSIFKNDKAALSYLENGSKYIRGSISIEHQIRRIKKELTPPSLIVDCISDTDNAKVYFYNEDYNKSYELWISIIEKNRHCNPVIQIAIKFAFDCLIKLDKNQEAIALFVNEYINNPIGIKKVDVIPFVNLLKKQKYKNIKRTIELPIFVGLNSPKDTDKSFILQSFCDYYDVKKPSELFDEITNIDSRKVEAFFYVIVSEDILRHYIYIKSTQESLEEKQKILDHLINMNTENVEIYKKNLDEVFEELIIYKGNKKMDESKIYANDQAIIKYELKDIEGLYDRFITQFNLLESGTSVLYVDHFILPVLSAGKSDASLLTAEVKYTDNAIHQVAYSLYDSVRDKFLFSKFGLGTYLSTRIRHGVFEGEIRSDFVAQNLVLNKENEKYVHNEFWNRTYGLDLKANTELFEILSSFSEKVDLLISHFKSEVLQIKIENTQNGFFDYNIDPETLSLDALEIGIKAKNSDEFCQLIIKSLWKITERNLQNIRNYIRVELSESFHNLLNELVSKLSVTNFEHIHNDFNIVISDARANINQKLLKIEGWFYIQESKFDDFKLDELMKIVWDSTHRFYPKFPHKCDFELHGAKISIKALYGIHFSDIFRIFLTNMFKNSSPNCDFKIKTSIEDSLLIITFENDINQNANLLNEKFKAFMASDGKLQLEGGSGLVKAQKIVKYDLGNIDNFVKISAENNKCVASIRINLQNLEA